MVYPRVCGGNIGNFFLRYRFDGLSPRVRGKPGDSAGRYPVDGSIPACAGETAEDAGRSRRQEVYPRVCGGNRCKPFTGKGIEGLSPRVRGKLSGYYMGVVKIRSIPACAGETLFHCQPLVSRQVYPRVCGGNIGLMPPISGVSGLSPRVRGKRAYPGRIPAVVRSIPACAGETVGC